MSRRIQLLSILGAVLLLSSCAHYQLGTGSQPKFATLYIAPVASSTVIPQAGVLVTTQLRESFSRDGRVTLVNSAATADAVLQITLSGYNRTVAVALTNDTHQSGLLRPAPARRHARCLY
jgi:Lipopolysaccharide-assembly